MAITNPKTLNVRIKNKYDSYENWVNSGLVLEAGEIAIAHSNVDVAVDNGVAKQPVLLMKVGNGTDTFKDLPWLSAKAADVVEAAKSTDALTAFISNVIADSGMATDDAMEALAKRVTDAEGEIDTLQADLNTAETGLKAKMTAAEAAITALQGLVGETGVAAQIQKAINDLNLANTYEAKGEAAKVQTALNEYKNTNDAAVLENKNAASANTNAITAIKDGKEIDSFADVENALAGKEAAGAAAAAQSAAEAYADSLAENYDAKGSAATAEQNAKDYANGLAKNYDEAGAAAQALTDAKDYTDGEIAEWVGDKTVGVQISEAIANEKLADTYAAKSHKHTKADITDFAHNHEIAEVNGLQAALDGKQAVGDYATKAEAQGYANAKDEAIAAAKKAGDDAQADVDALETYVGTIPETAEATNIVAYVQEKTAGIATDTALEELTGRVADAEGAIDAIEADYLKKADKEALQGDIDALAGKVGEKSVSEQITAVTDPLAARVKAVEDDYLKAADKTELEGKITTNANAIERLTNGVSAEEVDGVNDLIQYVKDHGTEVTGIKADIKANSDAIDAIEADYLKAADKTELEGKITAEAERAAGVEGGLDTRLKAVEGAVGETGSVATAIEGAVTEAKGYADAEIKKLAEGAVADNAADIEALETKVGEKTVAAQINEAIEALKIGDYAKAADLTAAIEQHNTDKAALEAEIAKKANDADLAAIAKSGSTDDLVQGELVLVFDCGGAAE